MGKIGFLLSLLVGAMEEESSELDPQKAQGGDHKDTQKEKYSYIPFPSRCFGFFLGSPNVDILQLRQGSSSSALTQQCPVDKGFPGGTSGKESACQCR